MKRKYVKRFLLLAVILMVVFWYRSCASIFGYAEEAEFTSPKGTNTIVVKYTHVSTPVVFKKGLLWDKKIWSYPNSGFMETVHFSVEWISENTIRLFYDDVKNDQYDEAYIIAIPQ